MALEIVKVIFLKERRPWISTVGICEIRNRNMFENQMWQLIEKRLDWQ